jgi:uncharacterized membrane protein (DUF485 family)
MGLNGGANDLCSSGRDATNRRGARYGHVLFAIYLVLYGGFVGITAFAPAIMERTPLLGINLSVLYGLGLIAAAFVLAVLYDWLCRPSNVRNGDVASGAPAGDGR